MVAVTTSRQAVAEGLGTALLLAAIVGSGIMAERLSPDNVALALLANTVATAATLTALILACGPISGAHFNPLVTVMLRVAGGVSNHAAIAYIAAQILGAFAGVGAAHLMFDEPLFAWSQHARSGASQAFAEGVATFGLLTVIGLCVSSRSVHTAFAVGAYIAGAYWFTSSTSFANPAVTLARAATDTFAGIRPTDVPLFLFGQFLGAGAAIILLRWLLRPIPHVVPETLS